MEMTSFEIAAHWYKGMLYAGAYLLVFAVGMIAVVIAGTWVYRKVKK